MCVLSRFSHVQPYGLWVYTNEGWAIVFIIRQSDTHHLRLTPRSVYFTPSLKTVAVLPFRKNQLLMRKPWYSVEHYTSHYQPMSIEHFILTWAPRHSRVTGVETELWWLVPSLRCITAQGRCWLAARLWLPPCHFHTPAGMWVCVQNLRPSWHPPCAIHPTQVLQLQCVCLRGVCMFCWNRF